MKQKVPVTQFRPAWAWLKGEEKLYARLLKGYKPVLHLFCGTSRLGDVRIDREAFPNVTYRLEIKPDKNYRLPFPDKAFDATIFDPPWINQFFAWASREVPRVTRRRIVAVTGNFWYSIARPECRLWRQKIYVVKGISPVAKLVFVYDFTNKTLSEIAGSNPARLEGLGHVPQPPEAEVRMVEEHTPK